MKRILIIGGGYGGLSCAIHLARSEKFSITLVDQKAYFLNLLQLHRTHFIDLDRLQVSFKSIAEKWGFEFFQARLAMKVNGMLPDRLQAIAAKEDSSVDNNSRSSNIDNTESRYNLEEYDFVIIASGGETNLQGEQYTGAIDLEDLTRRSLKSYLDPLFGKKEKPSINIVGGGATGIQYLFDIEGYLRRSQREADLQLWSADSNLLNGFPGAFHRYALGQARAKGIQIHLSSRVQRFEDDRIVFVPGTEGARSETIQSDLSLWFPGIKAVPRSFQTDQYGRVILNTVETDQSKAAVSERIFSVGDCSVFNSKGMNDRTAQAAVRKGKLVADNIVALSDGKKLQPYRYQALGYFVSLGSWDGVGWMLTRLNVLKGLAALVVKEAIESQFKLYLEGIDTYIG